MRAIASLVLACACSSDLSVHPSAASSTAAAPTFTTVEPPGGTAFIEIWTINESGTIGGVCDGCFADHQSHGVLRDPDGTYHPFDLGVAATFTSVRGISATGKKVGFYDDAGGAWHGFVGEETGVDVPGAATTMVLGVNERDDVVGLWVDAAGHQHAWVRWKGTSTFEDLAVPGANTTARGINNRREIVGKAGPHAFVWRAGAVTVFDYPNATGTIAGAIDDEGAIVGRWFDGDGVMHGFLLRGGAFTAIDVPGAAETNATGINSAGRIVGTYADADGLNHGFLAAFDEE